MERPLDIPDLFSASAATSTSTGGSQEGLGSRRRRRNLPPRASGVVAADADGRVYVVREDGGVSCCDIRDELLLDGKPSSRPAPTRVLRLDPPLEFHVEHACVSADGARLALAGRSKKNKTEGNDDDDGDFDDCYSARVVDVSSGGRPLPHDAASSPPSIRAFEAPSVPLAAPLFASRPGLRVLQLAWHPLSPRHVAVLTSDSCLRLYHSSAPADSPAPEQEFELAQALRSSTTGKGAAGAAGAGGLPLGLRALSVSASSSSSSTPAPALSPSFAAARRATGFAFGPPDSDENNASPWERLAVYIQASDGAVFSLCPVAPFGAAIEASSARSLVAASATTAAGVGREARAWVQRALPSSFGSSRSKYASSIVRIRPHALDEHSPALSGPLPVVVPGGSDSKSEAMTTHHLCPPGDSASGISLLSLRPGAIAILQSTSSGKIGAAALAGTGALPAFGSSAPRVALWSSSSRSSTFASSAAVDDDGCGEGSAASSAAASAFAAPGAASVSSVCRSCPATRGRRLLLLDVVDLSGRGKKKKNEIDDENSGGGSEYSDSDDEDGEEDLLATKSKRRKNRCPLTMLPDADDDARIYAVAPRTGEAFAVDVDWLPALAARLASSFSDSSGSSSNFGSTGFPRARARALRRGPTALYPRLKRIAGAAAVAAPPAEGGLVLLLEGGEAALARCARPAGAAAVSAPVATAASPLPSSSPLLSTGARKNGDDGENEPSDLPPPSPALARVLAGPRTLTRADLFPADRISLPSSNDASQPAGAAALAAAAKALLDGPVEFCHASSLALSGTFAELKEAAASTTERARALRARADAELGRRERSSIDRLARAKAMQENLEARARLLARLHWGLPQLQQQDQTELSSGGGSGSAFPATAAERAFASRELPEAEAEVATLASEVKALRRRAAALHLRLEAAGVGGGASEKESKPLAPAVAAAAAAAAERRRHPRPPPPATLRRVREAAFEQSTVVAALSKKLRWLEELVTDAEDEVGSGVW